METLLHISDLHFSEIVWKPWRLCGKRFLGNLNVILRRRAKYPTQRAEEFADILAAQKPAAVLLTGDVSSTATPNEFAQAVAFVQSLERRGLTVLAVPGNHDVYTWGAFLTRRYEAHLGPWSPGGFEPKRMTLDCGASLVTAPCMRYPRWTARGRVQPAHIEDIARLVAEAPQGPVLLMAHFPLLHDTPAYHSAWSRRLGGAEELRAALGETGRAVHCLAGHVHRFSQRTDPLFPNLTHITTDALFRRSTPLDQHGAFGEIRLDGDHVEYIPHRLISEKLRIEP